MMVPVYDRAVEKEVGKKFIKVAFGLSAFLVIAFIQAATWDQYWLEIIPLKTKQWIGSLSPQDFDRIAEICQNRKNLDCVESTLADKYSHNSSQIETLSTLGHIQLARKEFKQAANTLGTYFRAGGLSIDSSYDYAQALSEVGLIDQAAQYYQHVLDSKPDVMQVTVTQKYVKMLVGHNRYGDARNLIEAIRSKGGNATLFMETEMQQIEKASQVSKM